MSEITPLVMMPRYRCHKEVWALKIGNVVLDGTSPDNPAPRGVGAMLYPAERAYAPFHVDADYVTKHQPKGGGYYVVYADGYRSFSPAQAFEEGYTRLTDHA